MEVCGGHTHAIYRHGLHDVLPENVELVHGPGCPVCVLPTGRVDDGLAIAAQPNVVLACFGDMMRVPGTKGTPLELKARGADIRMVYSPLDALKLAQDDPATHVCFFAIGFETTAPSTALTLLRARELGVSNFSVFSNHVTIVPAMRAILDSPDMRLDGFVGPGHVSTIIGCRPFEFVARHYAELNSVMVIVNPSAVANAMKYTVVNAPRAPHFARTAAWRCSTRGFAAVHGIGQAERLPHSASSSASLPGWHRSGPVPPPPAADNVGASARMNVDSVRRRIAPPDATGGNSRSIAC